MAKTENIGNQKVTTYYEKDPGEKARESGGSPAQTERREQNRKIRDSAPAPKEGIFKKISKNLAPGLSHEARELGKEGIVKPVGRAVKTGVINTGARVGSLVGQPSMPVWLQDQRKSGSKSTRISGAELPGWIYGGGMPWDQPRQSSTVERVIVTRIHADGSRTRTERHPQQSRRQQSSRPDWIRF